MFKTGYTSITNIDISEVVIEQMKKIHKNSGEWLQMDATKMTFENESYTVVLDKGTLDAMMSEETESDLVLNYFQEVKRVLKNGGRFVIVSLLQAHIIVTLLNFFPQNNFLFRVVRCIEAELKTSETNEDKSSMPVFVVIVTKFVKLPSPIFEISNENECIERLTDSKALTESVLNIQRTSMIRNGLIKKNSYEDEIKFDLFRPNEKVPRFTLYILDQKSTRNLKDYAVFIAPQGRETEWLFSTKQGRRKLLESAQHLRLAIVVMHRNQSYTSLDDIKKELNETVKSFAPRGVRDLSKVPFLSLGSDVGSREIVHKGTSSLSGDFVVEDVVADNNKLYRRLIFLNNQAVIQSEALLKNGKKKEIDFSYLSCQHHIYMILGMLVSQNNCDLRNLVVGLGGGGLLMYIHEYLKDIKVDVVEIDPEIVNTAKNLFGLVESDRLKVITDDGLEVIRNLKDTQLNSVLFDVDSKDQALGISCPPKEFLDKSLLKAVHSSLASSGVFILNFVCRDSNLRTDVVKELNEIFLFVISYKLEEDVNEIFYCFKHDIKDYNERFTKAAKTLNALKRNTVDLYEFTDKLKINS